MIGSLSHLNLIMQINDLCIRNGLLLTPCTQSALTNHFLAHFDALALRWLAEPTVPASGLLLRTGLFGSAVLG